MLDPDLGGDGFVNGSGVGSRRWAVTMVFASFFAILLVVSLNAGYTRHVQQQADKRQAQYRAESDQRWCTLFALLDPAGVPPTTERGQRIQNAIRDLRRGFHCKAPS